MSQVKRSHFFQLRKQPHRTVRTNNLNRSQSKEVRIPYRIWVLTLMCLGILICGLTIGFVSVVISRNQVQKKSAQLSEIEARYNQINVEFQNVSISLATFNGLLRDIIDIKSDSSGLNEVNGNQFQGGLGQTQNGYIVDISDNLSPYDYPVLTEVQELIDLSYGQLEEVKSILVSQRNLLSDVPNLWPLADNHGNVTLEFGPNRHPKTNAWYLHKGIDIAGAYGVQVLASASGKVIEAGYDGTSGYGNYVLLRHKYGFRTRYSHLGSIYVQKGDDISQGEVLGTVGSTGISTGPHLDFQVILGSDVVDPSLFLKISRAEFNRWKGNR